MFGLLLKQKLLMLRNAASMRVVLKRLPFALIGAGFWLLLYLGTARVLSYVRGIELIGEVLSQKIFSMAFASLTGFVVLSSVITSISVFYLSKDIPFLLAKPIGTRDILRLKTIESVLGSSWMILSFLAPVFVAYGTVYNAPPAFYFSFCLAFLMFLLINAGIGISVAHLVTRFFPARRTRDALLGLSFVLFLGLYFAVKSLIPRDIASAEEVLGAFLRMNTDSPMLPGYWVTQSVFPLLQSRMPDPLYPAALLSSSCFVLLLSLAVGELLYIGNIEGLQPSGLAPRKGLAYAWYPARAALLYKDAKIFLRDAGQWSQIFIIAALVMVYTYNLKTVPLKAISGLSPHIREIVVLLNMLLTGLILSAIAARFLFTAVSLEGGAFWIVKAAPLGMRQFLRLKLLSGVIPLASLTVALVLLTNASLGVRGELLLLSAAIALLLSLSTGGLATGFGAMYPKFEYENISSVSISMGGLVFMLLSFTLVTVTLSLAAWVYYLVSTFPGAQAGLSGLELAQALIGILMILAVNAVAFCLPMRLGARRLESGPD